MKKINRNKLVFQKTIDKDKITLLNSGVILFFDFILIFILTFSVFQSTFVLAADDEEELLDKKEGYQEELEDLEKDAEKTQSEINAVGYEISKTQSVIFQTSQIIDKYEEEIKEKEEEIKTKEENIEFKRQIIAEYLRLFRRNSIEIGLITFDFEKDLGDYLRRIESFEDFQFKIGEALRVIEEEKNEVDKVKEEAEEKKEKKEEVLEIHEKQKKNLVYLENEKQAILSETNFSISEMKSKISKINNKLNAFLGGDFDMDDLIDAVKYADKKTGVRKEFIFAMLDKETDLGRFTGGCYYSHLKKHMKDADRDVFKDLMDDLGYDKDDKKLSCWPGYGYGGAMGVAQFMPTTWIGYNKEISSITGNNPANPWRLEDGVLGMALKLERAGADKKSKEHYAAKLYYCGGPSSPYWNNKCEAYADTVISWSKGYDDYF